MTVLQKVYLFYLTGNMVNGEVVDFIPDIYADHSYCNSEKLSKSVNTQQKQKILHK